MADLSNRGWLTGRTLLICNSHVNGGDIALRCALIAELLARIAELTPVELTLITHQPAGSGSCRSLVALASGLDRAPRNAPVDFIVRARGGRLVYGMARDAYHYARAC